MSYPRDKEGQIAYWERQIDYTVRYYKPWFDASQYLIDQYNLDASTLRERITEGAHGTDDPTLRVKSNLVFGWIDQSVANAGANHPKFRVTPLNKDGVGADKHVARISDHWYKLTNQLEQDKRTLLDAHLCPWGGGKLGWAADDTRDAMRIVNGDPEYVLDNPEEENLLIAGGQMTLVTEEQNHPLHIERPLR